MDSSVALASEPIDKDDPEILGLTSDSRQVEPGFLFAALAGSRLDGRRYIAEAARRGAAAVLTDTAPLPPEIAERYPHLRIIADRNPRQRFAELAANFYAPQPRTIAAVTGTNGKTSVTVFLRQIWQHAGHAAASLGTIGIVGPDFANPGSLTTPDPVTLHRELQALARAGIDHVALEASSHGLDQFRLDGLTLAAAGFTNLTRDHLDYHSDMAAYFAAKARLFTELLPAGGVAVLNADAAEPRRVAAFCRARGLPMLLFGGAEDADLRLEAAIPRGTAQKLTIRIRGTAFEVMLPLVGGFQISNALLALGLAIATGVPVAVAVGALGRLVGAPGRLEHVTSHPDGGPVIVDYAHTPDALETVLKALRPHCRGNLVVVFGCGGDRDPGKRPEMGAIACRLADRVIVTDDNPRSEPPAAIRRAILAACPDATEIGDRAAAIRAGLHGLGPEDLLLIAGKGHERGQIVGAATLPFEDAAEARAAVAELGRGS